MSVTLKKLAYQVIDELSNGRPSQDSPYKVEYVILKIRQVLNSFLFIEIMGRRNGQEDDRSIPSYAIATYRDISVLEEESTKRNYIGIPDFYINLKYEKGVHSIADMNRPTKTMIRIPDIGVYSNLSAGQLEGDHEGYYLEDNKAYFVKKIDSRIPKVLVRLVIVAPDKLGIDDPLPVAPENILEVSERVKQSLVSRGIQDKVSDGNKDIDVNVSG